MTAKSKYYYDNNRNRGYSSCTSELEECDAPTVDKASQRKAMPVFSGVLNYFPDAIREVARCSKAGNDQHHPGTPLHWDRNKSTDELDALTSVKVAWRSLANLQKELELNGEAPLSKHNVNNIDQYNGKCKSGGINSGSIG